MNRPLNLVAIIGSLRKASFNRAVFNAATNLANVELTEAPIHDVPLYDGDVEALGDPDSVVELKRAVDQADGLIIFTPEYNRSIPAVTKNAIDWLSRYPGDSALSRAAVGIVAASPGRHEAAGVRDHLAAAVRGNTKKLFETSLGIASISRKLDDQGHLVDPETQEALFSWINAFSEHVQGQDG